MRRCVFFVLAWPGQHHRNTIGTRSRPHTEWLPHAALPRHEKQRGSVSAAVPFLGRRVHAEARPDSFSVQARRALAICMPPRARAERDARLPCPGNHVRCVRVQRPKVQGTAYADWVACMKRFHAAAWYRVQSSVCERGAPRPPVRPTKFKITI